MTKSNKIATHTHATGLAAPASRHLACVTLASLLLLAGCAKQGPRQPVSGQDTRGIGSSKPLVLNSPVDVSQLREDAIAVVEELSKSADAGVRGNAVEAASLVPRLRAIIDAGLSDQNPGVRIIAASAVGRTQIKELIPRVRTLLNDRDNQVQLAGMYALIKNGQRIDQSPLGRMLMNDDSPWVSRQAAFVIGETGNRSALGLLRSAANNRAGVLPPSHQRPFQLQIAEAMVKLGEKDQLPVLRAALYPSQPEDLEGAALAVQILGELRDRDTQPR
jgi:HEAT repeat protein